MIRKERRLRFALLSGALLAGALLQQAAAQGAASAQQAASSPAAVSSAAAAGGTAPTLRPEIGVLLQDAQRLLAENKSQEAADKLAAAAAVTHPTPYELHVLARLKMALAVATDDAGLAAQQYQLASQGEWLNQNSRVLGLQSVAGLYYNAKNYAKAIEWTARYHQAGGSDPGMDRLLAQSYYLNADYANAAKALEVEVGKATSMGKAPSETQLKLLADSRSRQKDDIGYGKALETLVRYYPSKANWRTLMARLWAKPIMANRLQLDMFRLLSASAGFSEASDYSTMAALALQEGSVIEAGKVLEQGYAAGVLVAGDKASELQRLTDKVNQSVREDRGTLEKDVARARTLPDGLALFNYGFNLFQLGQTERAVAQMEQALTKGIARGGDLARLRLVAVYAQLNQRERAAQLLVTLAGKTEPAGLDDLVRYWNLFLQPT